MCTYRFNDLESTPERHRLASNKSTFYCSPHRAIDTRAHECGQIIIIIFYFYSVLLIAPRPSRLHCYTRATRSVCVPVRLCACVPVSLCLCEPVRLCGCVCQCACISVCLHRCVLQFPSHHVCVCVYGYTFCDRFIQRCFFIIKVDIYSLC